MNKRCSNCSHFGHIALHTLQHKEATLLYPCNVQNIEKQWSNPQQILETASIGTTTETETEIASQCPRFQEKLKFPFPIRQRESMIIDLVEAWEGTPELSEFASSLRRVCLLR